MRQADFIHLIEGIAPLCGVAEWDNCGMQVASVKKDVKKVAVALDPTLEVIDQAALKGCDFVLSHHPLSMKPRSLGKLDQFHQTVSKLIKKDIALYSAHTSLDANSKGPVGWLARELKMTGCSVLETTCSSEVSTYLVLTADAKVIAALASLPFLAVSQQTSFGLLLGFDSADIAEDKALNLFHEVIPADTPVAKTTTSCGRTQLGLGIIGTLQQPLLWSDFTSLLEHHVNRDFWSICGTPPEWVSTVAYCTGSGSSLSEAAFARGADVFITGDVKYHSALDTTGCIIDVGHFSLEEEMMRRFAILLAEAAPDVEITFLPAQDPIRLHSVRS